MNLYCIRYTLPGRPAQPGGIGKARNKYRGVYAPGLVSGAEPGKKFFRVNAGLPAGWAGFRGGLIIGQRLRKMPVARLRALGFLWGVRGRPVVVGVIGIIGVPAAAVRNGG